MSWSHWLVPLQRVHTKDRNNEGEKCLRLKRKRPRYCEIEDVSLRNSVEERVASSVGTVVEEPSDNVDLFDFSFTSQDLSKSMDGETEEPVGCSVGNIVEEPSQPSDSTDPFDFSITSQDLSKYMEV